MTYCRVPSPDPSDPSHMDVRLASVADDLSYDLVHYCD